MSQLAKKIVLIGHFGVGKSSLIRRFVEDSFSDSYKVTIGVHILKKAVQIPNSSKSVSLVIWDLEGNDDITNTRPSYLLGTHGFIYVFDVTRPATYKNLELEIKYIKNTFSNVPIKIVGNKVDLVTKNVLKQLNENFGVSTDFLTSAKTGDKVESLFTTLAQELIS